MRWFALKARPVTIPYRLTGPVIPHPYKYAMRNLEQQHFEVFCPTVREKWIYRGHKWDRERAVFTNYIFVLFDIAQEMWRSINSTRGVVHLLPLHAEEPQPVPVGFVEELQQRAIEEPIVEEIVQRFERDAIVRILAGALRDRVGRVVSSTPASTRVAVEAFAGREVTATMRTQDLALVGMADDGVRT